MKRSVLYFGSFNPIHNGHTSMARYVLENKFGDELTFIVSPQNPFKVSGSLATAEDRLEMARIAVKDQLDRLPATVSDIEFGMPVPSYTIDTLTALKEQFPDKEFSILIGSDIIEGIGGWKESTRLLADNDLLIYPRDGYELKAVSGRSTLLSDAPRYPYSSTGIRERAGAGKDISGMVSAGVYEYILAHELYGIEANTANLLASAKELYRAGKFAGAQNQFRRVLESDPGNTEAAQYIDMIQEIFNYRYIDQFNP